MIKTFCDRCDGPASTVSRVFSTDDVIHIEVIAKSAEKSVQPHICDNCLADLMIASVETFQHTKTVASYHAAITTAAALENAQAEIAQLNADKSDLIKRAAKATDDIRALEVKLLRANEQAELMTVEARKAKAEADKFIRKKEAEIRQRIEDEKNEPEYIAAVERRERIRSSR
jgi:hypothetical protein